MSSGCAGRYGVSNDFRRGRCGACSVSGLEPSGRRMHPRVARASMLTRMGGADPLFASEGEMARLMVGTELGGHAARPERALVAEPAHLGRDHDAQRLPDDPHLGRAPGDALQRRVHPHPRLQAPARAGRPAERRVRRGLGRGRPDAALSAGGRSVRVGRGPAARDRAWDGSGAGQLHVLLQPRARRGRSGRCARSALDDDRQGGGGTAARRTQRPGQRGQPVTRSRRGRRARPERSGQGERGPPGRRALSARRSRHRQHDAQALGESSAR